MQCLAAIPTIVSRTFSSSPAETVPIQATRPLPPPLGPGTPSTSCLWSDTQGLGECPRWVCLRVICHLPASSGVRVLGPEQSTEQGAQSSRHRRRQPSEEWGRPRPQGLGTASFMPRWGRCLLGLAEGLTPFACICYLRHLMRWSPLSPRATLENLLRKSCPLCPTEPEAGAVMAMGPKLGRRIISPSCPPVAFPRTLPWPAWC